MELIGSIKSRNTNDEKKEEWAKVVVKKEDIELIVSIVELVQQLVLFRSYNIL